MTTSAGTSSLYCSSATSSVRPTAVRAAEASWTVEPTTAGFSTVRPGPAARYQAPAAVPRTAITRSTMNRGALLRRYRSGGSPGRIGRLRARRRCRAGRGGPAGRERRGGTAGRELGRHAHVDDEGVVRVDERTRRRQRGAHAAHVGEEVEGVLVAERGIPARSRDDQRVDLRRDVAADGRRGRDVAVHVLVGHAQRALAGVRHLPGDHLEQQDAGRVDVGPAVGLAPLDLLGRQVGDRADDHPLRDALAVGLDRSGEAEVGDLDATVVGDQDVLGLDVAVDEAGGVRRREGLEHGVEEDERLRRGQRPVLPQDVAQGAARHVLHGEVDHARCPRPGRTPRRRGRASAARPPWPPAGTARRRPGRAPGGDA